jgi:hypothetical protein
MRREGFAGMKSGDVFIASKGVGRRMSAFGASSRSAGGTSHELTQCQSASSQFHNRAPIGLSREQ